MIVNVFSDIKVRLKFAKGELPAKLEHLVYSQKDRLWKLAEENPLSWHGSKFVEELFVVDGKTYKVVGSTGKPWDGRAGAERVEQLWILQIEEVADPKAGQ
jgi:hypothetical protein